MWAVSVTFGLLLEHAASKYHTGVLALGQSKNDHQPVFDHFMDEVSKLHNPKLRYCKLINSFGWVTFGLCFYLADKPKCNVQLILLGHGGATSKCFGHVTTYKTTALSKVQHCQSGQSLHQ